MEGKHNKTLMECVSTALQCLASETAESGVHFLYVNDRLKVMFLREKQNKQKKVIIIMVQCVFSGV